MQQTDNAVRPLQILSTLEKVATRSSETSALTTLPENDILHIHRRENLKSYISCSYFCFLCAGQYDITN
jgi:hypothetical protein